MVIGPSTSAEVDGTRGYANLNGILLVSPISTLMWKDVIRITVPFWRTDIYGNDLAGAVKNSFEKMGGRFVDGVGYTTDTGDLSASLNRINFIIWDKEEGFGGKAEKCRIHLLHKQSGEIYLVAFDSYLLGLIHKRSGETKFFISIKTWRKCNPLSVVLQVLSFKKYSINPFRSNNSRYCLNGI